MKPSTDSPRPDPFDKRALLEALRAHFSSELEQIKARATTAAQAAAHEENRPESDKDMRSTEESYVARGQALRAAEVEQVLARLTGLSIARFGPQSPIALSALVTLEHNGRRTLYFLVPVGGGERIEIGSRKVQTLATTSPLGAALLGLQQGDEAEVTTPQGLRTYEVVSVE